ncbi:GAF and ANTAR domain-containing protein [Nocardioides mesophilus]|uniref:GAF and ANTAR domain-containing protein n=1 Tax=Nocardioides mesophilus TaxID=433659 RepID=A0A7G9R8I8_9ACTN|nr:GAF and ANTAR domain-containing protein [Nocardioides mesophilus]QNN51913.1 GAF and ANTAR domain-containing protein [Nocardioides mesophilus]
MEDSSRVAAYFALVSRDLMGRPDAELTLDRVAERAVEVIAPCDFVGITLRRKRGRAETVASTSPVAVACDELQYELDEGPCLSAIAEEEAYLIRQVATDPRWPNWGPRAAERGIGSILSVRLADDSGTLGALNMYSTTVDAYDDDSVDLALVFASHAATAISATRLVDGLQTALQSRHLIGVAQGMLMAKYDMTLETAFEVLRRYSSHTNTKLREVARHVVDLRDLPADYSAHDGLTAGLAAPSPDV